MTAKLRHIAITTPDPWKTAEFYMNAFGLKKVGETDSTLAIGVYLSDGVINMALLKYKARISTVCITSASGSTKSMAPARRSRTPAALISWVKWVTATRSTRSSTKTSMA